MEDDRFELTRRKILAGGAAVGIAGAGAGLGTSSFFADTETFTNNRLVAGELDMKVSWEEHYSDWSADEAEHAHMQDGELVIDDRQGFMNATLQEQFPDKQTRKELDQGTADPCEVLADVPDDRSRPLIELTDVKPGDLGEVTFDFVLCDNPGFVWMNGGLVDESENGLTEPEADDSDEAAGVELADEIQVTVWYDDGDNVLEDPETIVTDREFDPPSSSAVAVSGDDRIVARGSLRNVLSELSQGNGIPLDGRPLSGSPGPDCFTDSPTLHYIGFKWELPVDHGNEVQSDSVTFDLGFYTEQCRHNDGPQVGDGPPVPETQLAKLAAQDTTADGGDFFGRSVAVDGDTALVGAWRDEDPNGPSAGSAYVFTRSGSGWSQQAKLAADDGDEFELFGKSVALDGDTALIGAHLDHEPNGDNAGSAYVFRRSGSGWSQQAKLAADDGDSDDLFGFSVAVDGDTALVGAHDDEDPNGDNAGSAYVFTRSGAGWSQQAKLAAQDPTADAADDFGVSVALDGGTALVGAWGDEDPNGPVAGSAYVFTRSGAGWSQQAKLAADDGDMLDHFGNSVAVNGDTALVGAQADENPNGDGAGSAYVFTRSDAGWSQQAKLAADDGDIDDGFGVSVALDGDTALVGAERDEDPNGPGAGSAYVFGP